MCQTARFRPHGGCRLESTARSPLEVRAVFVFAVAAYDIVRLPKLLAPKGNVCLAA